MLKAIILNSGNGSRMRELTSNKPKCMTEIETNLSILKLQMQNLKNCGINDVIITTGKFHHQIVKHIDNMDFSINVNYVFNELYNSTNYIYSIYCIENDNESVFNIDDEILLLHGDLVFDECLLKQVIKFNGSCMVVDSKADLPQKDFKAVIQDSNIIEIGIDCFENAYSAQPLYKLKGLDWMKWQKQINNFCINNEVKCYAENALNLLLKDNTITLQPLDTTLLCAEVDTLEDLEKVKNKYKEGLIIE